MSTQFHVDTAQISSAATDIRRISADLESNVAGMSSRLSALQGAWQGSASAQFQEAVGSWTTTQRQVRESLDRIETALSRAGAQYAEVEAANTQLFGR
ncbi:WXG100 family type VII secretion target [Austwickia chelonae]|uniref:WXG100 family type VII secretion target n=1 Tax=Austwickia chelonae TaxID=100225 RepID=UPI000E262D9A|nr:WXG100 family type VII secretion target [Austwickia chelonae]